MRETNPAVTGLSSERIKRGLGSASGVVLLIKRVVFSRAYV